jgi:signal transduction histidine kinase
MPPLSLRYMGVVAAVGAATGIVFVGSGLALDAQSRSDHREAVKGAAAAIANANAAAAASVEDVAAFFESSHDVTRAEFRRFAQAALHRPALRSLAWLPRVRGAAQRRRFERAHGVRIVEFDGHGGTAPAASRDEYFPVDYLARRDDSQPPTFGFDGSSEPTRRRTMHAAAMVDRPLATPPLALATGQRRPVYYMPVYDSRLPQRTAGERTAALRGFIVASIDTAALTRAAIQRLPNVPAVRITDGRVQVWSSAGDFARATSAIVAVGGRAWRIDVAFGERNWVADTLRWAILAVGLLLTGILWMLFKRAVDQTARAEGLVAERTGELEERNARLIELDGFKDQVIGLVSHDLRSPLTAINGCVDMLLEEEAGPLSADQRRWLDVTRRSADRLERRIDDLLLATRVNDGHLRAERSPTRVDEIAREIVEAALPQAAGKSLDLVLDADECVADVDGNLLTQTLDNLVSNAIKYTPDGGRVSVGVAVDGDTLSIRVADTGIGIAADQLSDVFEPFVRTPEAVAKGIRGTGLGLVIVKAVADAHGGSVTVASTPGRGSTFTIRLPARLDGERSRAQAVEPLAPSGAPGTA